MGHFCPPGSGSTTIVSTLGSENESVKIPFEWLLPQGPPTVEYYKNNKISEFLADERLHGTHGGEHIAGVRTQLTPFSLHPGSTSWNRSHFYPNMLFINKVTVVFKILPVFAMPNLGLDFNKEAVSGSVTFWYWIKDKIRILLFYL